MQPARPAQAMVPAAGTSKADGQQRKFAWSTEKIAALTSDLDKAQQRIKVKIAMQDFLLATVLHTDRLTQQSSAHACTARCRTDARALGSSISHAQASSAHAYALQAMQKAQQEQEKAHEAARNQLAAHLQQLQVDGEATKVGITWSALRGQGADAVSRFACTG